MCPIQGLSQANMYRAAGIPQPQKVALPAGSMEDVQNANKMVVDSTIHNANVKSTGKTVKKVLLGALVVAAAIGFAPKIRGKFLKDIVPAGFDKTKGLKQDYKGLFAKFADFIGEKEVTAFNFLKTKYAEVFEKVMQKFKKS